MAVIELARRGRRGRLPGPMSDLRVYVTQEKGPSRRFSVGVRVSEVTMKRLRWLVGDYVTAAFDDAAMTWTIRRVTDKTGNRLSKQGREDGCGTVRFAANESDLRVFGLSIGEGYDCSLTSSGSDSAVFKMT